MLDPQSLPAPALARHDVGRRRFLGYVIGGTTLMAAVDLGLLADPARADIPTLPQPAELYDLNDLLTHAAMPTANLITVTMNEDGTASFALPRAEVGQGITTSTAMIIAEELDLPVDKVHVTLAPARPELLFNQLTGGSNTTISTYTPIRVAAAIAKKQLLEAAAILLGSTVGSLVAKAGVIEAPDGSTATYGELATKAASPTTKKVSVTLKADAEFAVVGTPQNRVDALAAVTGTKEYTTDLQVADALPTMVCRAPTLNGTPLAVRNKADVLALPGVTDVVMIDTGVAVRAETFGQCIDGVRALDVRWLDGPAAGQSDADALAHMKKAELPMPALPKNPLARTVSADFTFWFRSNSAMDTNSAVADVRPDGATIWAGLKSPVIAQQAIAEELGLPQDKVTVNVVQSGGSFGRRLFFDAAMEAAKISKAMGKPVKLMWHRADDARAGRAHPLCTSRVRASLLGNEVLAFHQSHTSVETDYRHGLGELITANLAALPTNLGNLGFAETIFVLTQEVPYNFGVVLQTLAETDQRFNTGSMRNIYSPDVRCANELMVDMLAKEVGKDPYAFRRKLLRNNRVRAVLDKVAEVGQWGRSMPAGTAQGIAIHKEYKGASACLVEIDARPETVNREVRDAVTGPRVTKVTFAIDVGLAINPRGLEAQMQGCINDGIALALTSSLHLRDGHFMEASWDNYFYTRQWNTPPEVEVIVMPSTSEEPGGAGEAGVAATFAAVACAYARATGTVPKEFPINHHQISFEEKTRIPPVPESPVDGLDHTY
ncbi:MULTISPECIES: molybdopterin cofactor-binding domain-containing protein [unclassified Nocardioides]|uniref:molybdopterin cofactor-binding domain-containing protein n=1 Tax=unclassified Nocardioides TaxID=2615069 RepID=UPI0006FE277A|nr:MULTISPECIES: molybdopterin cofactor-binding domain-containing protein [unclassified Nocardioides]KQY56984.1 isoquinoline 1-oxidoreductase [Nocardioides sp. Root140]KRF13108.1 isoquinoline 1-oxidoreductase [Nocardioides sp. Soil796]